MLIILLSIIAFGVLLISEDGKKFLLKVRDSLISIFNEISKKVMYSKKAKKNKQSKFQNMPISKIKLGNVRNNILNQTKINWKEKSERESDPLTKPILINSDGKLDTRKTILAIDDDAFLLNMYGLKYVEAGLNAYTLTTANGDLVQKVLDVNPDVITLDIIMPDRDGFQALTLLKQDRRTKYIPIIMLTNQDNKQDIEKAMLLGAVDYIILAKTLPSEVVRKIMNILFSQTKDIPISKINLEPVRHNELSSVLIARIKKWKEILSEVELIPLDKTLDNFRKDTHPEREIEIWERIANAYRSYVVNHSVDSLEIKKEIYRVAFGISIGNVDSNKIPHLNNKDIEELSNYYAQTNVS